MSIFKVSFSPHIAALAIAPIDLWLDDGEGGRPVFAGHAVAAISHRALMISIHLLKVLWPMHIDCKLTHQQSLFTPHRYIV
jgi:hypothetical protein